MQREQESPSACNLAVDQEFADTLDEEFGVEVRPALPLPLLPLRHALLQNGAAWVKHVLDAEGCPVDEAPGRLSPSVNHRYREGGDFLLGQLDLHSLLAAQKVHPRSLLGHSVGLPVHREHRPAGGIALDAHLLGERQHALDVGRADLAVEGVGGPGVDPVAPRRAVPRRTLHVEGPEHPVALVPVPDLERTLPVRRHVAEQTVPRRTSRELCAEHRAIRQHQALEDVEVVVAGMVANVHSTASHRARRRVEGGDLVVALEHIPVRLHDLANEERVVGHVGDVRRVRPAVARVEVVGCARDSSVRVAVQAFGWMAHAVDAVALEMLDHTLLHRLDELGRRLQTPSPLRTKHCRHRLRIHLHAIHSTRREVAVHAVV
mmetsp:Transcript_16738/g.40057  ORF Transcript_16738/g.40057 Transcript_16738/m.40057 type:complete len:376 (+) Transcript_16738:609-1736(+)